MSFVAAQWEASYEKYSNRNDSVELVSSLSLCFKSNFCLIISSSKTKRLKARAHWS